MTIQELRIGNYLQNLEGAYLQVKGIDADKEGFKGWFIRHQYGQTSLEHGSVLPIPLTPELLRQIGFTLDASFEIPLWSLGKFELWEECDDVPYSMRYNNLLDVYVKHLHALQNLYFALTGNELTINL